jgi:Bacterial capsule synthesis protein PGA_cap
MQPYVQLQFLCSSPRIRLIAGLVLTSLLIPLRPLDAQESPKPKGSVRILFAGDIMLDNGPGNLVANGKDPFESCASLFEGIDLSIGNLECVLGRGGEMKLKPYVYRGATDSPRFLKKYFHAVSLANNHSLDFGPDGMVEMLAVLDREKLPNFGGGLNLKQAMSPFVTEIKGHKIAIFGFNEFHAQEYAATETVAGNAPLLEPGVTEAIKNAKESLGCNVVIPFLHWGEELMPTPRPDQAKWSRSWIDAGATAIIGAHPHVPQTVETYRGAPIVYSLGNFVFDYYPVDPLEWTGWIAILEISPAGVVNLEIKTVILDPAGCPKPAPTE